MIPDVIQAADMARVMAEGAEDFATTPLNEPLRKSAQELRDGFAANFTSQSAPESGPWPPHAPETIRRHGVHPLLILSGEMFQAATGEGSRGNITDIEASSLEVGVDLDAIPYARAQNYGLDGHIPQREFLDVDDSPLDACVDHIATHIMQQVFGGGD